MDDCVQAAKTQLSMITASNNTSLQALALEQAKKEL